MIGSLQYTQKHVKEIPSSPGRTCSAGFTVIELAIAVAVILTICAIVIPRYIATLEQAKANKSIADLRRISLDVSTYLGQNGEYPASLADINDDEILDPWGKPYEYLPLAGDLNVGKARKDHSLHPINADYDLYSKGNDGKSASPLTAKISQDDLIRANSGDYYGLASEY